MGREDNILLMQYDAAVYVLYVCVCMCVYVCVYMFLCTGALCACEVCVCMYVEASGQ